MKNITGLLIVILMAGSLNLNAQRGMRRDSLSMKHDSIGMHMRARPDWRMAPMMRGHAHGWMAQGMGPRGMNNHWMAQGMRPGDGMGMRNNAPGRRIMESIPGITQKQKDDLAKLNEQNQSEMKKLMEQHQQAVKQLREDHRKKVMNLLTDDQKKWLEEHSQESVNK